MKNLIIIGCGGFAREVYWHAQNSLGFGEDWQIKGFLDGDVKLSAEDYEKLPANVPVLGDVDNYKICVDDVFTCAIGTPQVRKKLIEKILLRGGEFINVIRNNTYIIPTAKIGTGVIIGFNCGISDNVTIEDFVAINSGTLIGHDVVIGKNSCLMSQIEVSGNAKIGEEVFIGSHATILPRSKVGDRAFIGAGSVVLKKVKAGSKVFGNPATEI